MTTSIIIHYRCVELRGLRGCLLFLIMTKLMECLWITCTVSFLGFVGSLYVCGCSLWYIGRPFTCTWCSPLWNQTSKWNSANSMKFREYTKVLGQFTVFVQYVCRVCWQSLYISIIAHELQAWLLHYSPVVLHGVLPESYYNHHILLVEGVYLLLKDIESEEDIDQSSRLLRHYCFLFAPLYGR